MSCNQFFVGCADALSSLQRTVGSGVVEVINTNQDSINKRAENEINIKYVLDLRDFPGDPVEKVLVHDYEVIANDPEVDIVVEVMGGVEPAYTFTKRALEAESSLLSLSCFFFFRTPVLIF